VTNHIELDPSNVWPLIERLHSERFDKSEARDVYLRLLVEVCKVPSNADLHRPMGQLIEGSTGEFLWTARYDMEGRLLDVDVRRMRFETLRLVSS
jgi:hypothetical protein